MLRENQPELQTLNLINPTPYVRQFYPWNVAATQQILSSKQPLLETVPRIIGTNKEIINLYGTDCVPLKFREERGNVIFTPFDISRFQRERQPFSQMIQLGIEGFDITSIELLSTTIQIILSALEMTQCQSYESDCVQQAIACYFHNLELYRLTQDKEGHMIRWGFPEDLLNTDFPLKENPPYCGGLYYKIYQLAKGRFTTYWFRVKRDAPPSYLSHKRRKLLTSTVGELENNNYLALETPENGAIVAIRKN